MSACLPNDPWTTMIATAPAVRFQRQDARPRVTLAEIEHAVDQHLRVARTAAIRTMATDWADDRLSVSPSESGSGSTS
jgi:hypothetical protein